LPDCRNPLTRSNLLQREIDPLPHELGMQLDLPPLYALAVYTLTYHTTKARRRLAPARGGLSGSAMPRIPERTGAVRPVRG
jgi:hypothetical protein